MLTYHQIDPQEHISVKFQTFYFQVIAFENVCKMLVSVWLYTRIISPLHKPVLRKPVSNLYISATLSGRMAMAATSPSMVVVVAAILCIGALMLPTHGEENSSLPRYLFLSTNQKLIAAYILGGSSGACNIDI